MSSVSAANQLADHLEHVLPPHGQTVPEQHSDPLIDTALRLARGPHPALSPDQVTGIETLVLARVKTASTND